MGTSQRLTVIAVALLGVLACESDQLLGPGAPQGIDGSVLLGPQCPVATEANPCPDLPYQAWINIRTEGGRELARIQSSTDGTFRVGLAAGTYVLAPESGRPFPIAGEQTVQVVAGVYATVVVNYDTGIR